MLQGLKGRAWGDWWLRRVREAIVLSTNESTGHRAPQSSCIVLFFEMFNDDRPVDVHRDVPIL